MTEISERLHTIRAHLQTGALGQREVWEAWLTEAEAEIERLQKEKADLVNMVVIRQDEVTRLREQVAALQASSGYEASIAQVEIERLRAVEDAATNAATYFFMGDGGEEDFDEQRMIDLMRKLGRALEPKP